MKTLEELSDKELVYRMNNGEKEKAFNVLYKRYNDNLCGFCFRVCYNSKLAKEAVLSVFEKLFEKSETFIDKPGSTFKTWFYRMARNHIIDYYRERAKERRLFLMDSEIDCGKDSGEESFLSNCVPGGFNPEEIAIRKQKKEYVENSLEKMKEKGYEKHYVLLKLRYYDGLSYEEISDKLKTSIEKVRAGLFRAKGFLGKELKSKKYFLED